MLYNQSLVVNLIYWNMFTFESYVILNTPKTSENPDWETPTFESYVILNTPKTCEGFINKQVLFESYVILNIPKPIKKNK